MGRSDPRDLASSEIDSQVATTDAPPGERATGAVMASCHPPVHHQRGPAR